MAPSIRSLGLVGLLASLVSGCAADVCGGVGSAACIGLRVEGPPGSSLSVDQIRVVAHSGFVLGDGRSPTTPGATFTLPVGVPVLAPAGFSGAFSLEVTGMLGGQPVGVGAVIGSLTVGQHAEFPVVLTAPRFTDGGIDFADAATTPDLAGVDLAAADLTRVDGSPPPDLAIRPPSFAAVVTHPACGGNPMAYAESIAALDLHSLGNGTPDLVVGCNTAGVHVLFNNAMGKKGSFAAPIVATGGVAYWGVGGADFDKDATHSVDIALAQAEAGRSDVLLDTLANGVVTVPATVTPYTGGSAGLSALVTGDFDGDSFPDIAVSDRKTGELFVWSNNGAGGFVAPVRFALPFQPAAMASGDVNEDGHPDLVLVGPQTLDMTSSGVVAAFIASGTKPITFVQKLTPWNNPGANPTGVVLVHVANHAHLDVVVSDSPQFLRPFFGDGTGGFVAALPSQNARVMSALAAGDVNRDTLPDLVTIDGFGTEIDVWVGDDAGGFATIPVALSPTGKSPRALAVADLDGDSLPDVAVANRGDGFVSVFINTTP